MAGGGHKAEGRRRQSRKKDTTIDRRLCNSNAALSRISGICHTVYIFGTHFI